MKKQKTDLERYLVQQQEILGSVLFIDAQKTIVSPEQSTESEKSIMSINTAWQSADTLPILHDHIHTCMECRLGVTRNSFVFGSGNPNADILIIGEAPGADEDAQGLPFVGAAGKLLTKILEAINLSRDEVYIANIIKCRPPENRRPEKDEIAQCEPYLQKQIEIIQPAFILALGLTAVNTLFKKNHQMQDIRGKVMNYHGVSLLATYHPAALLRNPNWKKPAWEDVQLLRSMYDEWKKSQ
ncbi:MAG: uracil-DNA glycosylase [Ignavibacteriae bacterium]|nr:uracil-DNA glycosylase [Ignavibacteriota bacterium]